MTASTPAAVAKTNQETLHALKTACSNALMAAHEAVDAVENGTMELEQLREANAAYRAAFEAVCNFQFGV